MCSILIARPFLINESHFASAIFFIIILLFFFLFLCRVCCWFCVIFFSFCVRGQYFDTKEKVRNQIKYDCRLSFPCYDSIVSFPFSIANHKSRTDMQHKYILYGGKFTYSNRIMQISVVRFLYDCAQTNGNQRYRCERKIQMSHRFHFSKLLENSSSHISLIWIWIQCHALSCIAKKLERILWPNFGIDCIVSNGTKHVRWQITKSWFETVARKSGYT